jgi:tricorn protease-like protein
MRTVTIWGVADRVLHQVTSPMSDSYEPVFDRDGK